MSENNEKGVFEQPPGLQLVEMTLYELVYAGKVIELQISYVPNEKCLDGTDFRAKLENRDGKSLSLEEMAAELMLELKKVLSPLWLKVVARQSPQNGIAVEATALFQREMGTGELFSSSVAQ